MTLPAWPVSLPTIPLLAGTGIESLHEPTTDTEVEDGPARAERTSTATWATIAGRFKLTGSQFATYQAFVRDTLGHGASRFTMPVWKPGATAPLPVRTVRIVGASFDTRGPYTFLTLQLRVRDY